jgi:hypothetical protein
MMMKNLIARITQIAKRKLSKKELSTRIFVATICLITIVFLRIIMRAWLSARMPLWVAEIDVALFGISLILLSHTSRVYAGFWFIAGIAGVGGALHNVAFRKVPPLEMKFFAICATYTIAIYIWKGWEKMWGQRILRSSDE